MLKKSTLIFERAAVPEEDDALLIEKVKLGESRAFKELYKNNVGRIYAVCLRISASKHKAEILTQDVFVKAWENIHSFRGESLFSTWLHRIAINHSLLELRSRKKRSVFISISEKLNIIKKDPEKLYDIENAIASLPNKARAVFVLHDIEGYKHEEISEIMNTSPGTSKAQLHRARKLIREFMKDEL